MIVEHYEIRNWVGDVKGKAIHLEVAKAVYNGLRIRTNDTSLKIYAVGSDGREMEVSPKESSVN